MTPAWPPTVTIVAGPNGAGKSTLTASLRAHLSVPVIDPDAIARALPPADPAATAVAAGREAIRQRDTYLAAKRSFLIETTLSGRAMLRFMEEASQAGFSVDLIFIGVERVQTLIDRIAGRAALGGHHVGEDDVRRRYVRSLGHLARASTRSSRTMVYDNSAEGRPRHVLTIVQGRVVQQSSPLPEWVRRCLEQLLQQW